MSHFWSVVKRLYRGRVICVVCIINRVSGWLSCCSNRGEAMWLCNDWVLPTMFLDCEAKRSRGGLVSWSRCR